MKAITIQQPYAFEIMTGQKTIELGARDTLHRGELLICSARKPAFSQEEMEEMEEEYGCLFLYGQALCVVRLSDVRPMKKGDEEKALADKFNPEAYSWVLEDVRPVIPFPVKGQQGLFDVDDHLVSISPFRYGEPVMVKRGTIAKDFGIDFSGWHGRTSETVVIEEGEARIRVKWDSLTLKNIPPSVIEKCEKEEVDWTSVLLRFQELEHSEARDTLEDVDDAIDIIIEENPSIFEEQ